MHPVTQMAIIELFLAPIPSRMHGCNRLISAWANGPVVACMGVKSSRVVSSEMQANMDALKKKEKVKSGGKKDS